MSQREQAARQRAVLASQSRRVGGWLLWLAVPLLVIGGILLGVRSCRRATISNLQEHYQSELPAAPTFTTVDLTDRPVSLEQFRGQVVLLDFWASWCGPCLGALPDLKALAEREAPNGLVVLGISQDHTREALDAALTKYRVTWPQIWDHPSRADSVGRRYGVQSLPTTVLIDRRGRVFFSGHTPFSTLAKYARFLLEQPD